LTDGLCGKDWKIGSSNISINYAADINKTNLPPQCMVSNVGYFINNKRSIFTLNTSKSTCTTPQNITKTIEQCLNSVETTLDYFNVQIGSIVHLVYSYNTNNTTFFV
jgi:hypothetical protein